MIQDSFFLRVKDSSEAGQTACERAFKTKYENDETMAPAIGDLIPFDDPKLPILHHVAKHAPQYMKEFACRYLHVRVGIHLQHISGIAREEHCTKCTCKWKQDFIDDPNVLP